MRIEIRDASVKARLKRQMQMTGAASAEEALVRLLETQEEQDRYFMEDRERINTKIRHGIEQIERGEGIPDDQIVSYLAKMSSYEAFAIGAVRLKPV
jgi:hypothetical protein